LPRRLKGAENITEAAAEATARPRPEAASSAPRVLVVEDEVSIQELLCAVLRRDGLEVRAVGTRREAQEAVEREPAFDVAILDVQLPDASGVELLEWLVENEPTIQVVMSTGDGNLETVRRCMRAGTYDYLLKPFDIKTLTQTVRRALHRGDEMARFHESWDHLDETVTRQRRALEAVSDATVDAMCGLVDSRDRETGAHLARISAYARILSLQLAEGPYADRLDDEFHQRLVKAAPLHDIGKVGIPDAILLKRGTLGPDEILVMREHTRIGGDALRRIAVDATDSGFLEMAIEIAEQHHEKWDGTGYPAGLAGEAISLAARIVALADAYDAITTARSYKPAYDHSEAIRRIVADRERHFDPVMVDAFLACSREFERVCASLADLPEAVAPVHAIDRDAPVREPGTPHAVSGQGRPH
jgi:cyclic di-GMP phosphodiesterase